jgi:long-chain fatty acid transport protein
MLVCLPMNPAPGRRSSYPTVIVLVTILILNSPLARAGSFAINEQSVSSLGSAYAGGAAQAEDVSTIFFNPAGLALLDRGELQIGGQFIIPSATFQNQGSHLVAPGTPFNHEPLTGGNGGDAGVDHLIPNVYLSQPLFRSPTYGDLSIGIGLSVPFGLETDYQPDWVGRYVALRTKLTTFDIQPTIAYRFLDRISIGASIDVQYASARLSQAIDFGEIGAETLTPFFAALPARLAASGVPLAAIPGAVAATERAYSAAGFVPQGHDGVGEVHGDDWSVGYTVGLIFEYLKGNELQFLQDGRFGFSYRSGIDHTLTGPAQFRGVPSLSAVGAPVQFPFPSALQDVFFNQSASAGVDLPAIYHFSLYQRFLQKFAVMGDIAWTRWNRLQQINISFSNPSTPANVLNLEYDDAVRYAVGFEWYALKQLTLRAGFAYDETPVRSDQTRTPRIPDNNRYFVSAGLRWQPFSCVAFDVGYAHLFVQDPTVDFTDSLGHNLKGKFDASINIISAAVTFLWGGPKPEAPLQPSGKSPVGYSK